MKIRNINFRQTKSSRSGTKSYQNFGKYIKLEGLRKIFKNYGKS